MHGHGESQAGRESVLEMVRRRPCSLAHIADGLNMHRSEVVKYVEELDAEGLLLVQRSSGDKTFYSGKQTT